MGGELGYADLGRVVLDDGPDDVDRQAVASDMTPLIDGAEDAAAFHVAAVSHSSIQAFAQRGTGRFAGAFLPQLDLLDRKPHEFIAPQSAAEEQSEHGEIAFAFQCPGIRTDRC